MNTTSLEQSKILKDILPIESADMCWCNNSIKGVNYTDKFSTNLCTIKEMKELFDSTLNGWDKYWELIPCWSLAALLSVLPANKLEKEFDGKWRFSVYLASGRHDSHEHDNPIDACYEIILRLNRLNLL